MTSLPPNPRMQRTPSAPLMRQPLGAAVQSVGRACDESLVLRVRSHASLRPGLLPHHRPGPVGFRHSNSIELRKGGAYPQSEATRVACQILRA